MNYFGFIPSKHLLHKIEIALQAEGTDTQRCMLRDEIALLMNDELIDTLFIHPLQQFPDSDKKQTAQKLAQFVKSSASTLLKQLFVPASYPIIQQSHLFLKSHLFHSNDNVARLGVPLEANLSESLKLQFQSLKQDHSIDLKRLTLDYQAFADVIIQHYMSDFHQTLGLGLFKRKASELGCITVKKSIYVALEQLLPKLTQDELKILAQHHDPLFFNF